MNLLYLHGRAGWPSHRLPRPIGKPRLLIDAPRSRHAHYFQFEKKKTTQNTIPTDEIKINDVESRHGFG